MPWYRIASEFENFENQNPNWPAHHATGFDSTLANLGFSVETIENYRLPVFPSQVSNLWIHFDINPFSGITGERVIFTLLNGPNGDLDDRIKFVVEDENSCRIQVRTPGDIISTVRSYNSTNGNSIISANTLSTIDVNVIMTAADTTLRVYKDNNLIDEFTSTTLVKDQLVDRFYLADSSVNSNNNTANVGNPSISQIIVSDERTVGMKLSSLYVTGEGSTTQWNGTFDLIDEPDYNENDADAISTDNINVKSTYQLEDIDPAFNSYQVLMMNLACRRRHKTTSIIDNFRFVIRENGVDYEGVDLGVVKDGNITSSNEQITVKPSDSSPLDINFVNGIEIGFITK